VIVARRRCHNIIAKQAEEDDKRMNKTILAMFIIALFIGVSALSAGSNQSPTEVNKTLKSETKPIDIIIPLASIRIRPDGPVTVEAKWHKIKEHTYRGYRVNISGIAEYGWVQKGWFTGPFAGILDLIFDNWLFDLEPGSEFQIECLYLRADANFDWRIDALGVRVHLKGTEIE
ncbi:MAG: hypothetical protein ACQXXD_05390, partial [Thermoplasmatota archaeon]